MRSWLIRLLAFGVPPPRITLNLGDILVLARPGGLLRKVDSSGRRVYVDAEEGISELELHTAVSHARKDERDA